MTGRTTIALWIIGVGFAIAALAGVPLIATDAVLGPGFWLGGLVVAVAGVALLATAVPGQRRANKSVTDQEAIDIFLVIAERKRLLKAQARAARRLQAALLDANAARPRLITIWPRPKRFALWGSTARYHLLQSIARDRGAEHEDVMDQLELNATRYFRRTGKLPDDRLLSQDPLIQTAMGSWPVQDAADDVSA